KDLDKLLESQITNKSKKGLGYSVVPPPHPLIYNRPKKLDLSYSGLDEFKEPEFKGYGTENSEQESNVVCDKKSDDSKENSLINYDHHQRKRIVSRNNYNRVDYDYYAKTTHPSVHRNMTPIAVLLKSGLTPLNTVRPVNTAHPKPAVHNAKSMPRAGNTAWSYTGPVNVVRAKGVGDKVVHKELGDRMERAATTASSLEAEQDSVNAARPNLVLSVQVNDAEGDSINTLIQGFIRFFIRFQSFKHSLITQAEVFQFESLKFLQRQLFRSLEDWEVSSLQFMQRAAGEKVYAAGLQLLEDLLLTSTSGVAFEIFEEDSSKQERKIFEIDKDPTISLVQHEQGMEYDFDVCIVEGFTTASVPVTTAGIEISTANISVSTASATPEVSTTARNLVYIRRSAKKRKDKGKAIMKEDKSVQKKTKKQLEQERLGHEEVIRLQEQFNEEEKQRIVRDAEIELNIQNRSFFKAEVRKNMCIYLKNQGGYKQSHFKGMKYEDIRPIFERVWDKNHSFVPKDYEIEKEVMKRPGFDFHKKFSKKRSREDSDEENAKKQKLEDDAGKKELRDKKKYPLTQEMLSRMLSRRLEVDQESEMAFELPSLGEDWWELNVYTLSPAKPILNTAQDITNSTNQLVLPEDSLLPIDSIDDMAKVLKVDASDQQTKQYRLSADFLVEFLLLIHSEPRGIFILVDRILELVHVNFRNICSGEKCRIAQSKSKSIQDNLKCRLSLFLSRIESSIAFSNLKPFLLGTSSRSSLVC
ncbi:hypothetical protein Tco_1007491, partial [Tanacetum coccineum]